MTREEELTKTVAEDLGKGKNKRDIIQALVGDGLPRASADRLVGRVEAAFNKYQRSPEAKQAKARRGLGMMVRGGLFLVGGLVATGVSFASESSGGSFTVFYGAVIYGAFLLVKGFVWWLPNRSQAPLAPGARPSRVRFLPSVKVLKKRRTLGKLDFVKAYGGLFLLDQLMGLALGITGCFSHFTYLAVLTFPTMALWSVVMLVASVLAIYRVWRAAVPRVLLPLPLYHLFGLAVMDIFTRVKSSALLSAGGVDRLEAASRALVDPGLLGVVIVHSAFGLVGGAYLLIWMYRPATQRSMNSE